MKTNTILLLTGVAALGGMMWYMSKNKSEEQPGVLLPSIGPNNPETPAPVVTPEATQPSVPIVTSSAQLNSTEQVPVAVPNSPIPLAVTASKPETGNSNAISNNKKIGLMGLAYN